MLHNHRPSFRRQESRPCLQIFPERLSASITLYFAEIRYLVQKIPYRAAVAMNDQQWLSLSIYFGIHFKAADVVVPHLLFYYCHKNMQSIGNVLVDLLPDF